MPGPRILIAEDDVLIGELLELRFRAHGYETRLCPDGAEAFSALSEQRPDLLIADIRLPGVDGLELLRRVREREATADMPVIVITAYRYGGEVEQARSLGADAVVRKPFQFTDLFSQVEALIRRVPEGRP